MTTQSALLLDPADSHARLDVDLTPTPSPARRPTLVVQSRHERPAPALVEVLLAHGLDPAVVLVDDDDPPDPTASPLAILVGHESVTDARAEGRLERELDWVRRADEAGTAVLGIGHGARLLALALGGAVAPAQHPWRGWALVDTTVPHIIPSGPWLAWQHDVIDLPPGAQLLAHNQLGPQAFRVGRHLAVQFHPEATPDLVAGWAGMPDAPASVGVIRRDPAAAAVCSWRLLSSFIDDV